MSAADERRCADTAGGTCVWFRELRGEQARVHQASATPSSPRLAGALDASRLDMVHLGRISGGVVQLPPVPVAAGRCPVLSPAWNGYSNRTSSDGEPPTPRTPPCL